MSKPKNVGIYLRVSTTEQTIENQRRVLEEVAGRQGWNIVRTFADEGVSGAKGRDARPGFNALAKAVARREIDMVAVLSVDRLGRSLQHLVEFLGEVQAKGCDLYIHNQGLDTSTPAGRAMFHMSGVFAEFERAIIRERTVAGIARAKAQGKHCGRRAVPQDDPRCREAQRLLGTGQGILRVAKAVGLGVGTVHKIAKAQGGPGTGTIRAS